MKLLFSIIIPFYNEERAIKRCIDSIISEKYQDYEIILVDDGSTDSSGKIADIYAEQYDNIVAVHKKNGGGVDSRRCGIRLAKGKYIAFVDADDYVLINYLDNLHNVIQYKAELYFFNSKFIYPNRKKIYDQRKGENGYINYLDAEKRILNGEDGYVWNKLYLTDILKAVEPEMKELLMFGDDVYINLNYFQKINTVYVSSLNAYVHICDSATSICRMGKLNKRLEEMNCLYDYVKKNVKEKDIIDYYITSHVATLVRTVASMYENGEKRSSINRILDSCKVMNDINDYTPMTKIGKLYKIFISKKYIMGCVWIYKIKNILKKW
ncbi:MAG: glycosyltransferase family 2 protein [Lachnospiraceae bacterium]|nr:glycosyltransferase family 2 protein [Lachnospiraceae bacterium]